MPLVVTAAQYSDKGPKAANDDALVMHLPEGFGRSAHMMIAAIADGVSSAESGGPAAMIATRNFCSDFLATDLNWSIKTAGYRVLTAINRWLHGQGQHYNHRYSTHLTTFSAVIIYEQSAHIFHVGDSRIWRFRPAQQGRDHPIKQSLECLTKDHTIQTGSSEQLIRALGMDWRVEVDYLEVDVQVGDYFLLTTDGIHGVLSAQILSDIIQEQAHLTQASTAHLEQCVQRMAALAQDAGSTDNQSCQLVHIDTLEVSHLHPPDLASFPPLLPDNLKPGYKVDGYEIVGELHANSRSSIYQAVQLSNNKPVILKSPSLQFCDNVATLHAFVQEDWIGQRIEHPDIVQTLAPEQPRQFLYLVQEYIKGSTLRRWREANPNAPVETVIRFVRPAVRALRALHRRETLHQDVKPDNFMVWRDDQGKDHLKLIDFGSAQVGSVTERRVRPGALEYAAPEYVLDLNIDARADQFALAVTFYEILTGEFPYGNHYLAANSAADFAKLSYIPASKYNPHVPAWMDAALMRACSLDVEQRYEDLGEWQADLERPNYALTRPRMPLMESHPVQFWQTVAALLFIAHVFWLIAWFR